MVWPPVSVTLPERSLLILHFPVDVKVLYEFGKRHCWPKPPRCPRCGGVRLWGHGFARRYFEGFVKPLWVKRFRCPDCTAVHTSRPSGFLIGIRYPADVVRSCLIGKIMDNRWLRGVVRQNQQYWYGCLKTWASRLGNVNFPSLIHLQSFLSERIFFVTEYFAPLRI